MHSGRIIEIIVKLLIILQDNNKKFNEDLENLGLLGYTQNEINSALKWINKHYMPKINFCDNSYKSQSHRIFHELEEKVITPEGRGYLLELVRLNLLTNVELETIIEKLMLTGSQQITLNDVKSFSLNYLLEKYSSSLSICNILGNGEKIN